MHDRSVPVHELSHSRGEDICAIATTAYDNDRTVDLRGDCCNDRGPGGEGKVVD
jgi:hypothetical protein